VALVALRHRAFSDNASGVLRRGHRHRSSRSWTQSHWRGPHRDASPRAVVCSRLLCVSAMLAGGSRWGRKATCVRRLAKMPSGACLKASNGRNALREIERKERARVTCSIARELGYGRYRCRQRELSSPAWGLCPVCAQCRSPMDIVLVAPDFENLMFATFRCGQCGLLDRREVQPDF